ncbi:hypothetical protein KJ693_01680 [bacterium]|nr:hypothetical protein [bacterium]MBU1614000.1 hypothetical protein [bacterium]
MKRGKLKGSLIFILMFCLCFGCARLTEIANKRKEESQEKFKIEKQLTPEEREKLYEAGQRAKGLVMYQGEWMTPEEKKKIFEEDQGKKGLVKSRGEWVTEEEKFAREQEAKGLVKYKREWMSLEEKGKAYEKDRIEKGLVRYAGKWMSMEEKERLMAKEKELLKEMEAKEGAKREEKEAIDLEVSRIINSEHEVLSLFPVRGKDEDQEPSLFIRNSSGVLATLLISGPQSGKITVTSGETQEVRLVTGDYYLALKIDHPDILPLAREYTLQKGNNYCLDLHMKFQIYSYGSETELQLKPFSPTE